MGNTPSPRSKEKPSPSDEMVELKPPADSGFAGTWHFKSVSDATLITELLRRGYVVVPHVDVAS